MKLTIVLLMAAFLQVSAAGYAQKISLSGQNIKIEEVFKKIKKQSDYNFFYDTEMLQQTQPVSIDVRNVPVEVVLEKCFAGQPLTFVIEKKTIVVMKKTGNAETLVRGSVLPVAISGKVTDEKGEGLPGVSVRVKGTSAATSTDINGGFRISVGDNNAVLVFSFIGFAAKEIPVKNQTFISVRLEPEEKALEEVVVIGYGTQRRTSVVGAIDQIKATQIEERPVSNLTQALQGASANLVIQQRSMNPNDNTMNINLRGVTTITNNSPLLVIDGIIADDINMMNNLNPNDIENISVLKDAGSAAIFGSRSANGVLLVTTKKGKLNMKPTLKFSGLMGTQHPSILLKPLKGYQNALLRNDAFVNTGSNPIYSSEQIAQFATGDSEYFLKGILKDGMQQNYNLSIQGGSSNTTYMISTGYYDQRSNFKGPDYGARRYNLRSNLTTQVGKFKLSSILWYDRNNGKAYQGDNGFLIADASRIPVYNTYVLKDAEGKYYANDVLTGGNPLAALEHGGYINTINDHFQASLNGELEIIKGLKAKGVIGYDLRPDSRLIRRFYWPVYSLSGDPAPINQNNSNAYHIEDFSAKATSLNTQAMLDFQRTFASHHNVTALVGYSNESYRQLRQELKRQYVDPVLGIPIEGTITDATSYNTPGGTTERSINSWFGRAGYSFDDRYYAEASFRYDGSTKFGSNNRWGFFPSFSAGWRISEEDFFSVYKQKVGDLKIRGSYGQLGVQTADDYQTFTTYNIYLNQYGFNNVSVPGTGYMFGNPDLKWETATSFNIGADASFFNGRLNTSFDYFHKNTKDILLKPETPLTLGGAVPFANLAAMANQGWELSVNYNLRHNGFSHTFGFNIGDSRNKVTKFEGNEQISKADQIERIIRVGLPLYSYYGYKTDGLFQNDEDIKNSALPVGVLPQPGDIKYKDRNGDGIIDDSDRYVLGHAFPRFTFGFTYDMQWKGFDVNMLWQGVGKRDMALRGEITEPFHGGYSFVMFEHQLDYWTPANTDAKWPRLTAPSTASYTNNYGKGSDFNIFSAAYLRLKNIQIGYTLPKKLTGRLGMSRTRVFVSGQNLLTFSKNSFIDPESTEFGANMNASGANSGRNYPVLKYIGGGINIDF
ncbi:TonB-dependent receptor [Pararcticibacter amylolyticus]|uniref:SusC/RagA family TonB-linked outer membrane protein n=1 Tax=Pararcticibacter amylolyticus TaxID=2173175 RepID=A0A2U2PDA1_9SPHI|nr:TonB-dependent receptor [Pararcticibacter amylolyticus]PWG79367.1 SusC/RagA family TonB-linked outer membrane protein [Pararcticibacter amylolyticus]